jgi:sigma-B regulation protein RsbU (phosphoserine phosphatase)
VLEDGEERLLGIRGPFEYFGELGLLDNQPRMASCITMTTTTVLEITEEVFDRLIVESPAVGYTMRRRLLELVRSSDRSAIEELTAKNKQLQRAYADLKDAQAQLVEKERLERELEIAAAVQRSLLPAELPLCADFRFAAYIEPARHVGGDLYDVIELDGEHVGLLMADVADKSVQAALFMAVTRTLFLVESQRSHSPKEVAGAVHRGMLEVSSTDEIFVTAFYGVLHRPTRRLTYVLAGQERPILIRPGDGIQPLSGRGRFLGMLDPLVLHEYSIELRPGDLMLLFSDGVPDASNPQQEQYGYERLALLLDKASSLTAQELVELVARDVVTFIAGAPAFDDLTLLAVQTL